MAVGCPRCGCDNSFVIRTWDVFFKKQDVRLRTRDCKRCGTIFTSYEFAFNEKIDPKLVAEIMSDVLISYPPVIRKITQN